MYSEESEAWMSSCGLYDAETMFTHVERYRRAHQYVWVNGKIVFPEVYYPGCLDVINAGYALLAKMGFKPTPSRPPQKVGKG
jgi:hypothetical protein